jgi:hypothetical protein
MRSKWEIRTRWIYFNGESHKKYYSNTLLQTTKEGKPHTHLQFGRVIVPTDDPYKGVEIFAHHLLVKAKAKDELGVHQTLAMLDLFMTDNDQAF